MSSSGMDCNKYIFDLYINDIKKYKLLTKEEERELLIRKANGDMKARETLINSNQLLIISMAKRKSQKYVQLLPLIQVGNIGLIRSIDLFDIKNDVKLSTFATPMINWEMNRYLFDNHCIRVPYHLQVLLYKINQLMIEYQAKGINYSYDSLAKDLNITKKKLLYVLFSPKADYGSHDEKNTEIFSDYKLEDEVEFKIAQDFLQEFLDDNLTEDEKEVLYYRYGFMDKEYTYDQIDEKLNLRHYESKSKEARALRKLRNVKSKNRELLMNARSIIMQ